MRKRLFANLIGGGLVFLGITLSLHGLHAHTVPVLNGPSQEEPPTFSSEDERRDSTQRVAERAVIQEITVGGIKRWANGDLQFVHTLDDTGEKVDSSGNKAEKACPT